MPRKLLGCSLLKIGLTYKLQVLTYKLQVLTYKLQVLTYKLQVLGLFLFNIPVSFFVGL